MSLSANKKNRPRYLALCARPTEPIVAAELRAIAEVENVEIGQGVVSFSGSRAALYQANLKLRCASRVLLSMADFECHGPDDLYAAAYGLPWEDYLSPDGTLAVAAHGSGPGLANSMFAAVRVKDAVCDRFRSRLGRRPDVDTHEPSLRINVQLYTGPRARGQLGTPRCALSIDSSDPPLHQRGYRRAPTAAPMKETLAAAIASMALTRGLLQAQAEAEMPGGGLPPIVDLCCGSGTLLIEAGLLALRRAPGLKRRFGFMGWRDFDAALWHRLTKEAQRAERTIPRDETGVSVKPFLFGMDLDRRAALAARQNLEAAGLGSLARVQIGDLRTAEPPEKGPGIVVCNPPYGERLMAGQLDDLSALYGALGETLKQRFSGYTAFVYTANLDLIGPIGLRPRARHILFNGNLEGRLLELPLY